MSQSLKVEAVSKNPFFQVLRQSYQELYSLAAKRGWSICVPHSSSISGATLNEHFFKSHILQSSPYFKQEFVTLNGQCVIHKDGVISTKTGFDSQCKARVLSNELFYTDDFKSFTVYCISAPLISAHNQFTTHKPNQHYSQSYADNGTSHRHSLSSVLNTLASIEDRSQAECKHVLCVALPRSVHNELMEHVEGFVEQFNRSYVMIKGYTHAASHRVEEFRNHTLEQLGKKHKYDTDTLQQIKCSLDSYMSGLLFDRVFTTFLVRHLKAEDTRFATDLDTLQTLSQSHIGIKRQFQCDSQFKSAVDALSKLNQYRSPVRKLGVLKRTFALIRENIETQHRGHENKTLETKEEMALTTDDMLSLFTFVLIHCNPQHILSNNEYIKHFYLQLHCTAHLDYFAATFQATIQYIRAQLIQKHQTTRKSSVRSKQFMRPFYSKT